MLKTKQIAELLESLGNIEEPLGVFYTDSAPETGVSPKRGTGHSCMINYIRMARAQREQAWFAADTPGCAGGWVYAGFMLPPPDRIAHFVTTGLPGEEGERYMPAPESIHRLFAAMDLQPAPGKFCIVKPLSLFEPGEEPLLVIFFARGEALTGLCQLAYFALDDHEAIALPFGAGCSNILAWPLHYLRKSVPKAVVGGIDPSCRPFMGIDELTFTVSTEVFETMLTAAPNSFLHGKTWSNVVKRIRKSREAWSK